MLSSFRFRHQGIWFRGKVNTLSGIKVSVTLVDTGQILVGGVFDILTKKLTYIIYNFVRSTLLALIYKDARLVGGISVISLRCTHILCVNEIGSLTVELIF